MNLNKKKKEASKLLIAAMFPLLLLGSGCMMHSMMDDNGHNSSHQAKKASSETGSAVQKDADSQKAEHPVEKKAKKSNKTMMILGAIGMGVMMALMIL